VISPSKRRGGQKGFINLCTGGGNRGKEGKPRLVATNRQESGKDTGDIGELGEECHNHGALFTAKLKGKRGGGSGKKERLPL